MWCDMQAQSNPWLKVGGHVVYDHCVRRPVILFFYEMFTFDKPFDFQIVVLFVAHVHAFI